MPPLNTIESFNYEFPTRTGNVFNPLYDLEQFAPAKPYHNVRGSRFMPDRTTIDYKPHADQLGKDTDFFFVNIPALKAMGVPPEYFTRIILLAAYTTHKLAIYDRNREISPARMRDGILKIGRSEFDTFYRYVLDNGILVTYEGAYHLSRKYVMKGYVPRDYNAYKFYRRTYQAFYSALTPSQHKPVGRILANLDKLNRHWNTFCIDEKKSWNSPDNNETDPRMLKPLSMREMCDILDIYPSNSARFFNQLSDIQFNYNGLDRPFLTQVLYREPSNLRFICINPIIVHGGTNWSAAEAFGAFFPRFRPEPAEVSSFEEVLRQVGIID